MTKKGPAFDRPVLHHEWILAVQNIYDRLIVIIASIDPLQRFMRDRAGFIAVEITIDGCESEIDHILDRIFADNIPVVRVAQTVVAVQDELIRNIHHRSCS